MSCPNLSTFFFVASCRQYFQNYLMYNPEPSIKKFHVDSLHYFLSFQTDSQTWFAPVEDYNDEPFPEPKWLTHCSHTKFEYIGKGLDLEQFADKFKNIKEALERLDFDFAKKIIGKIASAIPAFPDFLDPEALMKMKVSSV